MENKTREELANELTELEKRKTDILLEMSKRNTTDLCSRLEGKWFLREHLGEETIVRVESVCDKYLIRNPGNIYGDDEHILVSCETWNHYYQKFGTETYCYSPLTHLKASEFSEEAPDVFHEITHAEAEKRVREWAYVLSKTIMVPPKNYEEFIAREG